VHKRKFFDGEDLAYNMYTGA